MGKSTILAGRWAVGVLAVLVGPALAAPPALALPAHPHPVSITSSGLNGSVLGTGVDCAPGTLDQTRHWDASAPLPGGAFSALPTQQGLDLRVLTGAGGAALRGTDSRVTLTNARGTVTLALSSGGCAQPTLSFGSGVVSGAGTWTVVPDATAANAYRGATGSGTFALTASLGTATNPWSLALSGQVTIAQPDVTVSARAHWGDLGLDYLSRVLTVEYTMTNHGPGDAYAVRLLAAAPTPATVANLGPVPQTLGRIPAGGSATAVVRYRLPHGSPPCGLLVLGCHFTAGVQVSLTDALDDGGTQSAQLTVLAPATPLG